MIVNDNINMLFKLLLIKYINKKMTISETVMKSYKLLPPEVLN